MRMKKRAAPLRCLIMAAVASSGAPAVASPATSAPVASTDARVVTGATKPGDPVAGGKLYAACMGCHSLDDNDVGPLHRGVVGRPAGSVHGYAYSAALKGSGIVWTAAMLDRWLANPQKLVPGSKMYFSVAKAQDRADIVAYLAQQK